jgi:threonine dehydratase
LRAQIGTITFPIIQENVDGIITLSEEEIINSMQMIWERMKIIIEPSCAISLAAIIKNREMFEGKKVGLIMSGGNVDLTQLPW